jgi:hypothetical protein
VKWNQVSNAVDGCLKVTPLCLNFCLKRPIETTFVPIGYCLKSLRINAFRYDT